MPAIWKPSKLASISWKAEIFRKLGKRFVYLNEATFSDYKKPISEKSNSSNIALILLKLFDSYSNRPALGCLLPNCLPNGFVFANSLSVKCNRRACHGLWAWMPATSTLPQWDVDSFNALLSAWWRKRNQFIANQIEIFGRNWYAVWSRTLFAFRRTRYLSQRFGQTFDRFWCIWKNYHHQSILELFVYFCRRFFNSNTSLSLSPTRLLCLSLSLSLSLSFYLHLL